MHLPASYKNVYEYFHDAMQFLYDYQWVYRYPMTGLLVHDVLSQIPTEWQIILGCMSPTELTMLSNGCVQVHWPASLMQFLDKSKQLQLVDKVHTEEWKLSQELCRGLSPKKQHEVSRMTSLIHQECQKLAITKILDVGSGLAYLDFAVHLDLGYQVLGLESSAAYVATATQKATSLCVNCEAISFYTCKMSNANFPGVLHVVEKRLSDACHTCLCRKQESKFSSIKQTVQEASTSVCLVGLHTCGDLSAVAINMFLHAAQLQLMVLVPCCYHKIAVLEEKKEDTACSNFATFPSSVALSNVLKKEFVGYEDYLGRPLLRLASQESCRSWQHWTEEQHQQHSENLMARAVLDLAAHRLGLALRKKRRRCVRKSQRRSFETFLDDAIERYDFVLPGGTVVTTEKHEEIIQEMRELWLKYHKLCSLAEALTGLQAAMQATVESIILVDRMAFMQEQHQLSLDVVKVMDEELSPRCRALIARKLESL